MPKHNLLTQQQFIQGCQEKHGIGIHDHSLVNYKTARDKNQMIRISTKRSRLMLSGASTP